jgi:hypothetical protein
MTQTSPEELARTVREALRRSDACSCFNELKAPRHCYGVCEDAVDRVVDRLSARQVTPEIIRTVHAVMLRPGIASCLPDVCKSLPCACAELLADAALSEPKEKS